MIRVTKAQRKELELAGLIKTQQKDVYSNIIVTNKTHPRAKTFYVVEQYNILLFLGLVKEEEKINIL